MQYGKAPETGSRPADEKQLQPVPAKLLQNIQWLFVHGRRNLRLVIAGGIVLVAGWLISANWLTSLLFTKSVSIGLVDAELLKVATELRGHYTRARAALDAGGSPDLKDVDDDIRTLLKLDPKNGHALYYTGELARLKDPLRFTSKSCLKVPFTESASILDPYHNDFYRYLDTAASLAAIETGGDVSAEACYQRAKGYCPQRTAWIHHLLANDLYEVATASNVAGDRRDRLTRTLRHAKAARALYPPTGFEQCKPTQSLESDVSESLAGLKNAG